jgi:2-methylcitrate dehydratase PrpD
MEHKMRTPPPVTETLAQFVVTTALESISEAARARAKLHILDTLGVALAAIEDPAAKIALDYCGTLGSSSQASIWGTRQRASASTAALANGLLAHALDFDDWDAFIRLGHPTSVLLGAALPLAESIEASGSELLRGYVLGVEVIARLAANCPNVQERGFHSTPVWGSLGAAVACASLLRLEQTRLIAALGVAASAASGIQRQQGSMVKPFHAGNAARAGVEAALLAARGFTADPAILEAPLGFCDTFFGTGRCDYEKMTSNVGAPFFLESPGLGLKWHPCSAPQFLAADAALYLRREHDFHFDQVSSVEVRIPPVRYERHYAPEVRTGLRGKFAINYVVAMALLEGKLELGTFTDEKVNERRAQDALAKVRVICDPTIPEPGPYCPVAVELKTGGRLEHTAKVAKGHPHNPMTESEVLAKFRSNAQLAISRSRAEELAAQVHDLETVGSVRELAELLAPA